MANPIQFRRNATAGNVPTNGQLVLAEPALNTGDGKLFTENAAGTVIQIGAEQIRLVLEADNSNVTGNAFNDIANLQFALVANSVWRFEFELYIVIASTTATLGFNVEARSATGATGQYVGRGMSGVPTAGAATVKMAAQVLGTAVATGQFGATGATTAVMPLLISGGVKVSSTPGTLIASIDASVNATAMTVKAGSSLTAYRTK